MLIVFRFCYWSVLSHSFRQNASVEPVGLATVGTPRHDRGRCRNVVWVVRDDNGIRRDSINEFVERVTWPQH